MQAISAAEPEDASVPCNNARRAARDATAPPPHDLRLRQRHTLPRTGMDAAAAAGMPAVRLPLPTPPPPKFPTQKRPRPPLPFEDDDDPDDMHCASPNLASQLPIPKSTFDHTHINHRQRARLRRLMARRAAPPKRKRSTLPPTAAASSPPPHPVVKASSLPKSPTDPPRGNGRILPSPRPSSPPSLWRRLAQANAFLASQPRSDPRFVPARRPLDCISGLRVSIAVTLFPNGYARHDGIANAGDISASFGTNADATSAQQNAVVSKSGSASPGKPSTSATPVKSTNVAALPRYPYERASRDFLKALDLGLIPPPEDLPEPVHCHYYDGCLIAEVTDLRDVPPGGLVKPRPGASSRVLLRPEMSSVYHDLATITRNVDATVALLAEQKILAAIAGPVDCDPRPKLACSVQQGNVHTNTDVINIARRPKRRRILRPSGAPVAPLLSTAALLLIDATEKHQATLHNAILGIRSGATESSVAVKVGTIVPSGANTTAKSSGEGSVSSEARNGSGKASASANPSAPKKAKHGVVKPPKIILQLHKDNEGASGSSHGSVSKSTHVNPPSRTPQQRIRSIRSVRLILPDQKAKLAMQQAQAVAAADISGENAERVQIAKQQALAAMNKNGRPVYVLNLIKTIGRGVEVVVNRGLCGDKSRDEHRIQVGGEEEGHGFVKQFKEIAKKEGYYLLHDTTWAEHILQQRQQQARAAHQQRQTPGNTQRQPAATQSPSHSQNTVQAKVPNTGAMSQPRHQSNTQLLQLQKQKQLQLLQRQQMQRQRQAQAQAQTSTQPGQQHVSQLLQGAHHQPVQHTSQLPIPQGGQPQLVQKQHRPHMTLQQQQLLQQQLQQQQQFQFQTLQRRRLQHQMQRHDKGNVNMQQSAAMLAANGRGGQIASKGSGAVPANMVVPRAPGATSSMANMGSSALMGHNQVFAPSQLQQLQQMRTQQQLRAEHQRNSLMAAVADAAPGYPRNGNIAGNPVAAQHLQTQAIAGLIGSAAMASGNARPVGAPNLTGADPLTLQQHFKNQRENVEAQTRTGKR